MRLNKNQQETLMYQSRLLFKHDNVESALDRSLAITIYTNEVLIQNTLRVQSSRRYIEHCMEPYQHQIALPIL